MPRLPSPRLALLPTRAEILRAGVEEIGRAQRDHAVGEHLLRREEREWARARAEDEAAQPSVDAQRRLTHCVRCVPRPLKT
jgi:hypothetical protein